jgi:hypothetical protein
MSNPLHPLGQSPIFKEQRMQLQIQNKTSVRLHAEAKFLPPGTIVIVLTEPDKLIETAVTTPIDMNGK